MGIVTRAEVLAALTEADAISPFDRRVIGVEPRQDEVLLILEVPHLGGRVAIGIDWPDDELTGMSTGDPAGDIVSWVGEVGMWLDEELATADVRYVRRRVDPEAGHTIVEFASYIDPDVAREILLLAGLDSDQVCVPPHSIAAPIGLVEEQGGWKVYSTDREAARFQSELYAWGDLLERVTGRWPDAVEAAWVRWNGGLDD